MQNNVKQIYNGKKKRKYLISNKQRIIIKNEKISLAKK